jgi:uncharacterized protein (TIGR03000 family)
MYTVVLLAAMTAGPASTGQGFTHACSGCRGCYGCWGGFSGSGYNYMVGHGYQSAFTVYAPVAGANAFGCNGCYGCYGGWTCYGVPLPGHGTWHEGAPAAAVPDKTKPQVEETPLPKEEKSKDKKKEEEVRARLMIDVPADAKVFLDGQLLDSPVAQRVFTTPVLVPGHVYYYDLKVEVVRAGQPVAETQRIILQPGQLATARFPNLNPDATIAPVARRHE